MQRYIEKHYTEPFIQVLKDLIQKNEHLIVKNGYVFGEKDTIMKMCPSLPTAFITSPDARSPGRDGLTDMPSWSVMKQKAIIIQAT